MEDMDRVEQIYNNRNKIEYFIYNEQNSLDAVTKTIEVNYDDIAKRILAYIEKCNEIGLKAIRDSVFFAARDIVLGEIAKREEHNKSQFIRIYDSEVLGLITSLLMDDLIDIESTDEISYYKLCHKS